jgi:hypothetical protein
MRSIHLGITARRLAGRLALGAALRAALAVLAGGLGLAAGFLAAVADLPFAGALEAGRAAPRFAAVRVRVFGFEIAAPAAGVRFGFALGLVAVFFGLAVFAVFLTMIYPSPQTTDAQRSHSV